MPRKDRAYGVWHSIKAKGGSKRKGTGRIFNKTQATTSRYATKRNRRTDES